MANDLPKCPYCGTEMAPGYLRGNKGYALLWTTDPFKASSIALGDDFWLCLDTEIERPTAHLCRPCKKIILAIND